MIHGARISIATTPTPIEIPDNDPQQESVTLVLRNLDASNNIDLGGQDVRYGSGFTVKPTDVPFVVNIRNGEAIYAAAQNAAVNISVLVVPIG